MHRNTYGRRWRRGCRSVKPPVWRCKTYLIDPPFLFVSGAVVAFAARRLLIARKPNPFGPSAWVAVMFACFFWASVSWFAWKAPDWMLCYFLPAETVPLPAVHVLFLVSLILASLSGHTVTAVLLQRGRTLGAVVVMLAGVCLWLGLWGLTLDRYMAVGTHQQWLTGSTVALPESEITGAMNLVGILQVFAGIIPLLLLRRAGQRLRPR